MANSTEGNFGTCHNWTRVQQKHGNSYLAADDGLLMTSNESMSGMFALPMNSHLAHAQASTSKHARTRMHTVT